VRPVPVFCSKFSLGPSFLAETGNCLSCRLCVHTALRSRFHCGKYAPRRAITHHNHTISGDPLDLRSISPLYTSLKVQCFSAPCASPGPQLLPGACRVCSVSAGYSSTPGSLQRDGIPFSSELRGRPPIRRSSHGCSSHPECGGLTLGGYSTFLLRFQVLLGRRPPTRVRRNCVFESPRGM
jgi:hypothetical protein